MKGTEREIGRNAEIIIYLDEDDGSITLAPIQRLEPHDAIWIGPNDVCALMIAVLGWLNLELTEEREIRALEEAETLADFRALPQGTT